MNHTPNIFLTGPDTYVSYGQANPQIFYAQKDYNIFPQYPSNPSASLYPFGAGRCPPIGHSMPIPGSNTPTGDFPFRQQATGTQENGAVPPIPAIPSHTLRATVASEAVVKASEKRRQRPRRFLCPLCPQGFTAKHSLDRHVDFHKGVRYPCSRCSKTFGTKWDCRRHEKAKHENTAYLTVGTPDGLSETSSVSPSPYLSASMTPDPMYMPYLFPASPNDPTNWNSNFHPVI